MGYFQNFFSWHGNSQSCFLIFFMTVIWLCFKEWFPECVTQSISQINHSACQYQVYQGSTALLTSNLSSSHHPLGSPPPLNTSIFSALLLLLVPYIEVFPIIFSVFTVFLNFNFHLRMTLKQSLQFQPLSSCLLVTLTRYGTTPSRQEVHYYPQSQSSPRLPYLH